LRFFLQTKAQKKFKKVFQDNGDEIFLSLGLGIGINRDQCPHAALEWVRQQHPELEEKEPELDPVLAHNINLF